MVEFGPDAYVVRAGIRGVIVPLAVCLPLVALFGGLWALVVFGESLTGTPPPNSFGGWILIVFFLGVILAGSAGLYWFVQRRIKAMARRDVLFAMDTRGVFLSQGGFIKQPAEWIPWQKIRMIEFFKYKKQGSRGTDKYQCIGLRTATENLLRGYDVFTGMAANSNEQSLQRLALAGDPWDVDGTAMFEYRAMEGWRANRPEVEAAANRFAPNVIMRTGPNRPAGRWLF